MAVLVAVGTLGLWPRQDRIPHENFDRIRDGISLAEVEAILGPLGDYRTRPTTYQRHFLELRVLPTLWRANPMRLLINGG
jgi:hypothetical protein